MSRRPKPRLLEAEAGQKTRREKHGVISYLNTGKLPSGRAWERMQVEVRRTREALIQQYGGDKIQPDVLALVESAMEGLMVQRLSSLYIKKAGIMRADSLAKGNFELHSVLCGQFISYANLVRLNLEAAARLAKEAPEDEVTLAEIVKEYREKDAGSAQEARDEALKPEDQGEKPDEETKDVGKDA